MRWIVISLLLINALIFGWRWFGPESTPHATATNRPDPEATHAIELLAEASVEPIASESAPKQAPLLTEVPPLTTDESAAVPAELPTTEINSDGSSTASPATGVAPAADTAVANDSAGRLNASSAAEPAPAIANKPAAPVYHCAWTAWAGTEPVSGADIGPALGAEVVQEQQREFEIGRSYLVYIPGKGSRELTLARLAEVKALGVEAAFLNKGPQAGGISLGLFSKPESMQVRLTQLKQAGVADARGLERVRTEPQSRRLLRWTGEKTPTSVQNQALISCNDVAPTAT